MQSKIRDYPDIAEWWDKCAKVNIRTFCMGVSDHLARIRRDTKRYLFAYLNVVLCDGNWKEVARVRKQLKEILQQRKQVSSILILIPVE